MAVPLDLENFAPSIDGTVEEWYAMDAKAGQKQHDRKEAGIFLQRKEVSR